jgi:hypothetical protein
MGTDKKKKEKAETISLLCSTDRRVLWMSRKKQILGNRFGRASEKN